MKPLALILALALGTAGCTVGNPDGRDMRFQTVAGEAGMPPRLQRCTQRNGYLTVQMHQPYADTQAVEALEYCIVRFDYTPLDSPYARSDAWLTSNTDRRIREWNRSLQDPFTRP